MCIFLYRPIIPPLLAKLPLLLPSQPASFSPLRIRIRIGTTSPRPPLSSPQLAAAAPVEAEDDPIVPMPQMAEELIG